MSVSAATKFLPCQCDYALNNQQRDSDCMVRFFNVKKYEVIAPVLIVTDATFL